MVIYGVYIVSKSGGLIFNHDHNVPRIENERTFNFPLDIKLNYENKKIVVSFGQKDGINGKTSLSLPKKFLYISRLTNVFVSCSGSCFNCSKW